MIRITTQLSLRTLLKSKFSVVQIVQSAYAQTIFAGNVAQINF